MAAPSGGGRTTLLTSRWVARRYVSRLCALRCTCVPSTSRMPKRHL